MLGLWSVGTAPLGLNLHIAFEVEAIDDLLDAPKRLQEGGIVPLSFFGYESLEPSVIGWMPAAAVYFRDQDNHLMEYLTMLDNKERRPDLGIVSWSDWVSNKRYTNRLLVIIFDKINTKTGDNNLACKAKMFLYSTYIIQVKAFQLFNYINQR
jgi:hypothetical protein